MRDIKEIIELAKEKGVDNNPLFLQTLENYETVQKAIAITNTIIDQEQLTITKEYVKGRENTYLHPAVKELPKQIEIANKTCAVLMKIILNFGNESKESTLKAILKG